MGYTPTLDRIVAMLGGSPDLLTCKWGHNHSSVEVKARSYPKRSPGRTPGQSFHCENHTVEHRMDDWITYGSATAAAENGSLMPCAICFPNFNTALKLAIQQRGR